MPKTIYYISRNGNRIRYVYICSLVSYIEYQRSYRIFLQGVIPMIEDISYSRYNMLEDQYYSRLGDRKRSSILINHYNTGFTRIEPRPDLYIYTSLYVIFDNEHRIQFYYDPMISHHP